VDESNLQRQVLHGTSDIGRAKLDSARDRITEINPHVQFEGHPGRFSADNALELVRDYDMVVDGTDNFAARYLANDACVMAGKPNVHGAIFRFEGQASVFHARGGPCYRCLFPEPPEPGMVPNCAEGGVLGVLPGIIGSIQAAEAIKLILGAGDPLIGRLLLLDSLRMEFREIRISRNPECPVCGDEPRITELVEYEQLCSPPNVPLPASGIPEMTVHELKARLERGDPLTIIDVREPHEWEIANLGAEGATLIPLGELPERLAELDQEDEIVLQCRSGARSARAAGLLRAHGFRQTWNLEGGILAWADEIEPGMPKY
jgi:adenylyltransferase/sulfurtransferase